MPSPTYLGEAVLVPLGLEAALEEDAAAGMVGNLRDMLRFGREALAPTLIAPETLTREPRCSSPA